jgi:hypothetical protein
MMAADMRWSTGVSTSVSSSVDSTQAMIFEIGGQGVAARRNHISQELQVILAPVAVGVAAANTHIRPDEGRS